MSESTTAITRTAWRVYCAPDGCSESYVGEYPDYDTAVEVAEAEPAGVPRCDWDTYRAAGGLDASDAPDEVGVQDDEPESWHGSEGWHCVVRVQYPMTRDEVAQALREYIEDREDDEDRDNILDRIRAARVGAKDIGARIESEDGEPEALSEDSDTLWTVGSRRLLIGDESVAEWTRCVAAGWDRDGYWESQEDTEGGDRLPERVAEVLDALGLEDDLPESADEPEAPEQDPTGEWGVGYTSTDPIHALPDSPEHRYATQEDAEVAITAWTMAMRRQYPGGWLAPNAVLMQRDEDGQWQVIEEDL